MYLVFVPFIVIQLAIENAAHQKAAIKIAFRKLLNKREHVKYPDALSSEIKRLNTSWLCCILCDGIILDLRFQTKVGM